jgi:predicted transcriptional regulator
VHIQTDLEGLSLFFKEHQVAALRLMWKLPDDYWVRLSEISEGVTFHPKGFLDEKRIGRFLDVLAYKGFLERRREDGSMFYRHLYSEPELLDVLSRSFLDRLLGVEPEL